MISRKTTALIFTLLFFCASAFAADVKPTKVLITGGEFQPLYGLEKDATVVRVGRFLIDSLPVTNGEYFAFVKTHPQWKKGKALPLLSDERYLEVWKKGVPDAQQLKQPVVFVPWFAASEYCHAQGGRLPSTFEWEFVAAADETRANASRDPAFIEKILEWYSRPNKDGHLPDVGGKPNYWGVSDLHGLVWEWTVDFNSVFQAGDSRREGDALKNLFCGTGAEGSADRGNYAAFMRYALRNSLKARYSTANLGFRCAYDEVKK